MKIKLVLRVFTIWAVVRESEAPLPTARTPQPVFNPTLKHSYRDPEEKRRELGPKFRKWDEKLPGVEYKGFVFAGKAEFPWVVHIKDYDDAISQEWYSIGNLLSTRHVLTVCRAVTKYNCIGPVQPNCKGEPDCTCKLKEDEPYIILKTPEEIYVYYFSMTEWEENMWREGDEYMYAQGNRINGRGQVALTLVHPHCSWDKALIIDMAVVVMKNPIPAFNMWLGVIQVPVLMKFIFDDPRLKFIEDRRILCYVGTVGGWFNGLEKVENVAFNYKVKYRAYPTSWEKCEEWQHFICRGDGCTNYKAHHIHPPDTFRIECWETRHRVGAVCDHDRGAPLVCEGRTEGIVIRAALHDFCNAGEHLPFMVQRIVRDYPQFLEVLKLSNKFPLPYNPLPIPRRRSFADLQSSSGPFPRSIDHLILISIIYCITDYYLLAIKIL